MVLLIWWNNVVISTEKCPVSIVEGVDELMFYNLPFQGWHPLRLKQIVGMFVIPCFAILGMLRRKTYDDLF